jgi:hypothetical protein
MDLAVKDCEWREEALLPSFHQKTKMVFLNTTFYWGGLSSDVICL